MKAGLAAVLALGLLACEKKPRWDDGVRFKAVQLNKTCPQAIDEATTATSASYDDGVFTIKYTLSDDFLKNFNMNKNKFLVGMRDAALRDFCGDVLLWDGMDVFREHHGTYKRIYFAENGEKFGEATVVADECPPAKVAKGY